MNEDNMNLMRKAVKGSMQNIKLKDGKLKMDSLTASGIMSIYDKANNKNKKSIEKMINTGTKSQIIKLQSLAMKSVKYGYKEDWRKKFSAKTESVDELDRVKHLAGVDPVIEDSDTDNEEPIEEAQSEAQKAAFQKMLDAKNGKKEETTEETDEEVEYKEGSETLDRVKRLLSHGL